MAEFREIKQMHQINPILPQALGDLVDSCASLDKVAEYCENNYAQNADKKAAFLETKDYVNQSLASVAYQLDLLAFNFLKTLDNECEKLDKMNSEVRSIARAIHINEEKAARQKIGYLAVSKSKEEQFKIVAPANVDKTPKYYHRKPIDYSILDVIGHGKPAPRRLSTTSNDSNWKISDSLGNLSVGSRFSEPMPQLVTHEQISNKRHSRGSLSALQDKFVEKMGSLRKLSKTSTPDLKSVFSLESQPYNLQKTFVYEHAYQT